MAIGCDVLRHLNSERGQPFLGFVIEDVNLFETGHNRCYKLLNLLAHLFRDLVCIEMPFCLWLLQWLGGGHFPGLKSRAYIPPSIVSTAHSIALPISRRVEYLGSAI